MQRRFLSFFIALLTFTVGVGATYALLPRAHSAPPSPAPVDPGQTPTVGAATLEMVFVLDTTGSMSGLLEGAKQRIWGIVNDVMQSSSRPAVRIGLVAYRDRGDEYETKVLPLTNNLDEVYSTLMDYQAGGGGDGPENVRRALADGVREAGWSPRSPGVAQIIFLVGDAPPHDDYANEPDTVLTAGEAARAGMVVNTIQCGSLPGTKAAWEKIALNGQGQYFAIAQDGGVQAISTPYDKPLAELGAKIGGTYLAYGGSASNRAEAEEKQKNLEMKFTGGASVSAAADRAVNKAVNAEAYASDLLQEIENGKVNLETLKDEYLPDDLRKLDPAARKQEVEKRLAERRKLRAEILQLSKKRDDYLAAERKQQAGKRGGFDAAVAAALREQLQRRGIKL
ncbi:MAG TPA: VWA domain-containing protein [Blastocatellia bacterium]|nr:VWA domain-containing protein [Blastocatellia bacterium]